MPTQFVKVFVGVPVRPLTRKRDGRFFENPPVTIRDVIARFTSKGVGVAGKKYDQVSCSWKVESRFRAIPESGAIPSAGEVGVLQKEAEEIIAFVAPKSFLGELKKEIMDNHPYETPVIDVFDLVDFDP